MATGKNRDFGSPNNTRAGSGGGEEPKFNGKKGGLGMGKYVGHGYTNKPSRTSAPSSSNPNSTANMSASRSGAMRASSSRSIARASQPSQRSHASASSSANRTASRRIAASSNQSANRSQANRTGGWSGSPDSSQFGKPHRVVKDGMSGIGSTGKKSKKSAKAAASAPTSQATGKSKKNSRQNTNKKSRPALRVAIIVIIVLIVGFYGVDAFSNYGKIHSGVSVGGLDVGGMTVDEATQAINDEFGSMIDDSTIAMCASQDAEDSYNEQSSTTTQSSTDSQSTSSSSTNGVVEISFDYDVLESINTNLPKGPVFTVSPQTLGAAIDAESLANEAYSIGRGWDFVFGRLRADTVGTPVDLKVTTDETSVTAVSSILTSCLGTVMVNPGISYQDGQFVVTDGNDGYMVEEDEFVNLIDKALLGDSKSFVIPMSEFKMESTADSANDAAVAAQAAIAQPVTLVYASQSWELDSSTLAQMISTYVDNGKVVPYVSLSKVESVIPALDGIGNIGTPAHNVKFKYDGTNLLYTESTTGEGPDYAEVTKRLNFILFGDEDLSVKAGETSSVVKDDAVSQDTSADDAARRIVMELTTSYPTMTFEDAQNMGLNSSLIYSYTTDYAGSSDAKINNIRLLSDTLTNTVIAPGETFSINDIAGECNAEKGFQEAGSILNGEVTSEIGGGICQVATTIFNTAFNAGYEIVERHNHSNYMSSYPDGLDAAISWPYLDMKFKNNTDNYVLLLLDYDDTSVTCSLWGISLQRSTEYKMTDWEAGEKYPTKTVVDDTLAEGTQTVKSSGRDGHTTTIVRDTYSTIDNSLISEDTFTSVYLPKTEIIVVGPNTTVTTTDDENTG